MQLTPDQFKRLKELLLTDFPTEAAVQPLVRQAQNKTLDQIATGPNLEDKLEKLIDRAQTEGWLGTLIETAGELRENNAAAWTSMAAELRPQIILARLDPYDTPRLQGDRVLLDRGGLRSALRNLNTALGKRILVVQGERGTGRTHSYELIKYLANPDLKNFKAYRVDLLDPSLRDEAGEIRPEMVGERIAELAGFEGMPGRQNEQDARWAVRFCNWLMRELEQTETMLWIVLDSLDRVLLPEGTRYFIEALVARIDSEANQDRLRLVLLGYADLETLLGLAEASIESEAIPPVGNTEVIQFFRSVYEYRQQLSATPYTDDEVTNSAVSVLRQVDLTKPGQMRALAQTAIQEVKRILAAGG
jgi:hypothetical protein